MDERMTEMASGRRTYEPPRGATERTAEQMADRFGAQKNTAAREARGVARALHSAADQLDNQAQGAVASYTRRAAHAIERVGSSLENKTPSQMLGEFERACREHPALVGVGTVVLGFLGARLLRNSARSSEGGRARELIDPVEPRYGEGGL